MPTPPGPLLTYEVRWFLRGPVARHPDLRRWFETALAVPREGELGPPVWQGRRDAAPDVYLLVPGAGDMGVKWREGLLQIKGRLSTLGVRDLGGGCAGQVERWTKWSYDGLPDPYRRLFADGGHIRLATVAVHKVRALRKVCLDLPGGDGLEVDPLARMDRGLGFELTDIRVAEEHYCSVAFEAFPGDTAMEATFARTVGAFLDAGRGLGLAGENSLSYPVWLDALHRRMQATDAGH